MDKLEDGAITNHSDSKSLHSIAISLKRIADALEGKNVKQPIVMSAEDYAKFKEQYNG